MKKSLFVIATLFFQQAMAQEIMSTFTVDLKVVKSAAQLAKVVEAMNSDYSGGHGTGFDCRFGTDLLSMESDSATSLSGAFVIYVRGSGPRAPEVCRLNPELVKEMLANVSNQPGVTIKSTEAHGLK